MAEYSKITLPSDGKRVSPEPIYTVVGVSMALMVLLQAAAPEWRDMLRYDRQAVAGGEIWRLLSGNFVHLGWGHLALNLLGLGVGTWMFAPDRPAAQWLLATLMAALAANLGLLWFAPSVHWCVGLSGVLHGLMVVGFGHWAWQGERYAWALLGLVASKMAWEQLGGNMPWASELAGGVVVVDAHLWGATGGLLYLLGQGVWSRHGPRV
jgi:rhomboid family GlyGly-CTERM serine protease